MKLIVQKSGTLNEITCALRNTIKRTRKTTPLVRAVKRTINRRSRKENAKNLVEFHPPLEEMDLIEEVTPQKKITETESDSQLNTGCTVSDINNADWPEKVSIKVESKVENNANEEIQPQEEIKNENGEEDITESLQPKQAEEYWSADICYTVPSPFTESEADFEAFPLQF